MSETLTPTPDPTPTPTPSSEAPSSETPAEWYAGLPDDLKSQPAVTQYKTLADAIQSGLAAERRLGVPANQLVRLPTDPADRASVVEIYKKLGAPETVDGYKIDLAGASEADKVVVGEFAKHMFEKGPFPPDALAAAAEFWKGRVDAEVAADAAAETAAMTAAESALKTEWGAAYDSKKAEIGKLVTDMGGADLAAELDLDTKIGNSPALARFLAKVVDLRAEPGPAADGQRADVGTKPMTPGEAKFARAALEGDPVKGVALRDPRHAMHAVVVAERGRLLAFEGGSTPA